MAIYCSFIKILLISTYFRGMCYKAVAFCVFLSSSIVQLRRVCIFMCDRVTMTLHVECGCFFSSIIIFWCHLAYGDGSNFNVCFVSSYQAPTYFFPYFSHLSTLHTLLSPSKCNTRIKKINSFLLLTQTHTQAHAKH